MVSLSYLEKVNNSIGPILSRDHEEQRELHFHPFGIILVHIPILVLVTMTPLL